MKYISIIHNSQSNFPHLSAFKVRHELVRIWILQLQLRKFLCGPLNHYISLMSVMVVHKVSQSLWNECPNILCNDFLDNIFKPSLSNMPQVYYDTDVQKYNNKRHRNTTFPSIKHHHNMRILQNVGHRRKKEVNNERNIIGKQEKKE